MAKAMAKPSWKWKMRKKMSEREREGLICHFIIFTASFAAEQENIGSLLAIITMNGHKNPTLFYDPPPPSLAL